MNRIIIEIDYASKDVIAINILDKVTKKCTRTFTIRDSNKLDRAWITGSVELSA